MSLFDVVKYPLRIYGTQEQIYSDLRDLPDEIFWAFNGETHSRGQDAESREFENRWLAYFFSSEIDNDHRKEWLHKLATLLYNM